MKRYLIQCPNAPHKGVLYVYLKKGTPESAEFTQFVTVTEQYPDSCCYYLDQQSEAAEKVTVTVFLNLDIFLQHYREQAQLPNHLVQLIQQYALNQYKIYQLRDCGMSDNMTGFHPASSYRCLIINAKLSTGCRGSKTPITSAW